MKWFLFFKLLWLMPWLVLAQPGEHAQQQTTLDSAFTEQSEVKYVCPMHPQIVRDHPGTCPICGMDLVEQIFEQSQKSQPIALGHQGGTGMKQGLAIRTTEVQKTTLWKYIPHLAEWWWIKPNSATSIHAHRAGFVTWQ